MNGFKELQNQAHQNAINKGFWDDYKYEFGVAHTKEQRKLNYAKVLQNIPEKLCLIHSEVSEALEDYRKNHNFTVINEKGKPIGLPSELADIVIRVMDLSGALGIDLEKEIIDKMKYNETREYMHGKKI